MHHKLNGKTSKSAKRLSSVAVQYCFAINLICASNHSTCTWIFFVTCLSRTVLWWKAFSLHLTAFMHADTFSSVCFVIWQCCLYCGKVQNLGLAGSTVSLTFCHSTIYILSMITEVISPNNVMFILLCSCNFCFYFIYSGLTFSRVAALLHFPQIQKQHVVFKISS